MKPDLAVVAVAIAAAAATTTAHAQPSAEAKKLYLEGKAHYDVAEYADAIAKWKQAYVVSKAPMLLFNIAQAYRLSGDCAQALRSYATYEREAAKPIANAEELALARSRCNPAPTNANPPDGTPAQQQQPPPPAHPRTPEPPTAADPEGGRDAHAAPSGIDAINEPPAPPELHESTTGRRTQYLGLGVAGAGVALAVTGYLFGRAASSHADEVSSYIGEWSQAQADLASSGQRDATIGKVFAIAGGAAIVGGAVLYGLGWHAHGRAQLALSVTPSSSEVAWSVHF